ncbi:hypothetical protein Cadr_000028082 [Camelus dromedarius]|uniref:Uncharacterized protein n=1 Tax=Camelus dromedarius TaxID=9838 RepID=A0A5N4CAU5_CAMDR|nr:hypothetical protein Cadr_000028082 [Camelus dromedarius]
MLQTHQKIDGFPPAGLGKQGGQAVGRVSGKAWMGSMWGESGLQTQQPGSGRLREVEVHWQGQVGSGECAEREQTPGRQTSALEHRTFLPNTLSAATCFGFPKEDVLTQIMVQMVPARMGKPLSGPPQSYSIGPFEFMTFRKASSPSPPYPPSRLSEPACSSEAGLNTDGCHTPEFGLLGLRVAWPLLSLPRPPRPGSTCRSLPGVTASSPQTLMCLRCEDLHKLAEPFLNQVALAGRNESA